MIKRIIDFLLSFFKKPQPETILYFGNVSNREDRRKKKRLGHNKKMTIGNFRNNALFKS